MTTVGIIANPASGKDIRRLIAHGSVFDNQEKVNIVRRVMLGFASFKPIDCERGFERQLFLKLTGRIGSGGDRQLFELTAGKPTLKVRFPKAATGW